MKNELQKLFPILQNRINDKPLVYLDNAATTQKPKAVIEAMEHFYYHNNANVHRGIYKLSECASNAYEQARKNIALFINAKSEREIIFVRGATEAINLVAASYGYQNFVANDEIIISAMEHHSNIVSWQLIAEKTRAKLQVINVHENGKLDLEHYEKLINKRTKMVAITHVSNSLGTINPIKKMVTIAHSYNIPVLVDGAQAVAHQIIDVQSLDCDFYVFSGHKMYGPTGIGVLYGKGKILDAMPPYQGGGDMIKKVTFAKTEYADLPQKFEAGTQNIAGVVGLDAAIRFINSVGMDAIIQHEQELLKYVTEKLLTINGLKIIGSATAKIGIVSFIIDKIHPHDVATILDIDGVAVRAGHHCTMPLMDFYRLPGTTRASFGVYNNKEDIDALVLSLAKAKKIFG